MRYNVLIYVPPLFLPYMKNIHKSTFLALNTGDLLLHEKKIYDYESLICTTTRMCEECT